MLSKWDEGVVYKGRNINGKKVLESMLKFIRYEN